MLQEITVQRDADGVQSLLSAPMPDSPDLYSFIPCGRGQGSVHPRRYSIFPQPAVPAKCLAEQLQLWLQDEVSKHAPSLPREREVQLQMAKSVPEIRITEDDICQAAVEGVLGDAKLNREYRRWCIQKLGVKIVRPDELFGWASESTDFWAAETLQEQIRCNYNVHVTAEDMRNAAHQSECRNQAAQSFFDHQAIRHSYLVVSENRTEAELARIEREGPYYTWEPVEPLGSLPPPWDGICSGSEFAYKLGYEFASQKLQPSVRYSSRDLVGRLRYIQDPACEPDDVLVKRISKGEWAAQCDAFWKFKVVRVKMYAWTITSLKAAAKSPEGLLELPDTSNILTAADMAQDMQCYLHVEADARDVEAIAAINTPRAPAVKRAWTALAKTAHGHGYRISIEAL